MRWRSFLALATVVVVGGGVALEFAARRAAVDISRSFEPLATLTYASAGITLDGSVRLQAPRLEIHRGLWQGKAQARVAEIRGSSVFWLVWRSLSGDTGAPDNLRVRTHGLHLVAPVGQNPVLEGWMGSSDLVMFENLGCGSDVLGDKDRLRMGVDTRERNDDFLFVYDSTRKSLNASIKLESEGIAAIDAFAEVSGLDIERLGDPAALAAARLTRAGMSYGDTGYFSRRNHFCAQWLGSSSTEFIKRHVGAVADFLSSRGIVPSKDLLTLYENLISQGGTLSLTSLPDASWIPSEIAAYPREALLRQLNITARLKDAPPIMLRLAFSDPEATLKVVESRRVAPSEAVVPVLETAESANPGVGKETGSEVAAVAATIDSPEAHTPLVSEPPVAQTVVPSESVSLSVAKEPDVSQPRSDLRVIASAPPPPKDSTLALVWKPGQIERLAPGSAKTNRYRVVPNSQLASLVHSEVQLLTSNGKRIDGQIKEVLGDHVVLQIQVVQGNAQLNVPLDGIREVRVFDPEAR